MSTNENPSTLAVTPLTISFDIQEAANNIGDFADDIHADGSNRAYIIRSIKAEMVWLGELLDELEEASP